MKKFLVFVLIAAAGYFAYEYLLKEKQVLEIKADKVVTVENSMDIEAPLLYPPKFGMIQGTVKNVSDKGVSNILLKYMMDAKPLEARIDHLEPGEERNFSTPNIMVRNTGVAFYLDSLSYE